MICENCNKQKATAYYNTKKVCEDCFFELSHMRGSKKPYECVVCKKIFLTRKKPSFATCSRNCRDKLRRRIKRDEDALNKQYKAFCGEVKV